MDTREPDPLAEKMFQDADGPVGKQGHAPVRSSRRAFLRRAGTLAATAALGPTLLATPAAAQRAGNDPPGRRLLARDHGPHIAHAWARRIVQRVKADGYAPPGSAPHGEQNPDGFDHLTGFTPTSAARLYAYVGIAMYEAVRGGMPAHRSLAGQLNGMPTLPGAHPSTRYDWPTALSAAVADTARVLFNRELSRQDMAAFHAEQVQARRDAGVPPAVITDSVDHGRAVAAGLQPWIHADGFDEIRQKATEHGYIQPEGDGLWRPTPPHFGPALEPYWRHIRPFFLAGPDEVIPAPPVPFSDDPGSAFYAEALHTYEAGGSALTDEHRHIARFWSDDPRRSGLPPGHWMLTVGQVAVQRALPLDVTVEAMARTGVAMADAFLSCWHCKYTLNVVRPVTYINDYVDKFWGPLLNTPPFPEYTSGHSVSSVAAAVVLTDLLGSLSYTDTYDLAAGLTEAQRTRHFDSFLHAAQEAAQSRIYGGIHFPMGVDEGKVQGRRVGELAVARLRTRGR